MEKRLKRKPDRRILKTKKAIINAFAELISQKDINDITIKEISDTADISRKTFYYYYDGIWDLVEEIQSDFANNFTEILESIEFKLNKETVSKIVETFKSAIESNYKLYKSVFYACKNPVLSDKIMNYLKERFKEYYYKRIIVSEEDCEFSLNFILSGAFRVFRDWFENEKTKSVDEFVRLVIILMHYGVNGLIDNKIVSLR
ncbi:TetR/AcrR family transcriptional regulator [bacterium]|nr:TetR/AcrR family transcriptional regulator [bacterium]